MAVVQHGRPQAGVAARRGGVAIGEAQFGRGRHQDAVPALLGRFHERHAAVVTGPQGGDLVDHEYEVHGHLRAAVMLLLA